MQNPINIATVNVQQFGFQTDFYPSDKKMVFDISALTIFKPGGANNIKGVGFIIIDPSGVNVHSVDWSDPDINTAAGETAFEFNIPSGFALYGYWQVTGILQEADGRLNSIALIKKVCQPEKTNPDGTVPAEFKITANCDVPSISVSQIANLSFCGLPPAYTQVTGMLYYPQGTLDPVAFSMTPFTISGAGKVYTGTYTVRSKTDAVYDLDDYFLVHLFYTASLEKTVSCTLDLCRLLCCVKGLQDTYEANCNNNVGRAAKEKLDSIAVPLMIAVMQDKCGQSSAALVQEIFDDLGCDCVSEGELAEPMPIGGAAAITGFDGECATEVIPTPSAGGIAYKIKTKLVSVTKGDTGDLAFSIATKVTDCNIQYLITFDYKVMASTILNTIKSDTALSNLLNSIVTINLGFDFAAIDGKCIIDTKVADYSLSEKITGVEVITGIVIDSIIFTAPANLLMNNQIAISTWLNSLNKGSFNVYYNPLTNTTLISSTQNKAMVSTLNVTIDGIATARLFVRVGVDIYKFMQAVVDYICTLSASGVKLGKALQVCAIDPNGKLQTTAFTADAALLDYLIVQNTAQCTLVAQLINMQGINCAKLQAVFLKSSNPFLNTDVVYGTKDGQCAPIERKVLAQAVLTDILSDSALYTQFCTGVNSCSKPICLPGSDVTVIVDNGVSCAQVTDIVATVE